MTTASKAVNLDNKDIANPALVTLGVNLIKNELGTEVAIFDGLIAGLTTGALSVRGGKATISAINEIGELPSIAVTSVQYLLTSNAVRQLSGGKDQPLKKVIGVATQGTRKMGKAEFDSLVALGGSFSALAKKVENLPAKEKASADKSAKVSDIDGAMAQFLKALEDLEDITPKSAEITAEFFEKVNAIKLATRANHPAVKAVNA
jgi:hypothetical protein